MFTVVPLTPGRLVMNPWDAYYLCHMDKQCLLGFPVWWESQPQSCWFCWSCRSICWNDLQGLASSIAEAGGDLQSLIADGIHDPDITYLLQRGNTVDATDWERFTMIYPWKYGCKWKRLWLQKVISHKLYTGLTSVPNTPSIICPYKFQMISSFQNLYCLLHNDWKLPWVG